MSTVSYAHAAAGSTTAPVSDAPSVEVAEVTAVEAVEEAVRAEVGESTETEAAEVSETIETNEETEAEATEPQPRAKNLSPAPLPAKLAWGVPATLVAPIVTSDAKWPTPEAALTIEQEQTGSIKPVTGKWMPLKANLVIASPKSTPKTGAPQQKKTKASKLKVKAVVPKTKKALDDTKEDETEEGAEVDDKTAQRPNQKAFKKSPLNNRPQNGTFVPFQNRQNNFAPQQNNRNYINGLNGKGYAPNNFNYGGQFNPNANYQNNSYYTNPQLQSGAYSGDTLSLLTYQIDHYFSVNNLLKDLFLRKNFTKEAEGRVPVGLILSFARLQKISQGDINLIKKCLIANAFKNVEVFGLPEKKEAEDQEEANASGDVELDLDAIYLRVKENWEQWLVSAETDH